jgi:hypothetical protein
MSSIISKRSFLNICRSKHLDIIRAAGAHHPSSDEGVA